ncbi:Uncharacterised protein [Vibrio parahaemolyticus]|nr:Uncharacterised protein [Vibrio parahaemolyticus]
MVRLFVFIADVLTYFWAFVNHNFAYLTKHKLVQS